MHLLPLADFFMFDKKQDYMKIDDFVKIEIFFAVAIMDITYNQQ